MKYLLLVISALTLSSHAMASVQCEQKLEAHFKKEGINTNELRATNDYSKPRTVKEEAKLMEDLQKLARSQDEEEGKKIIAEMEKAQVSDSRKNEIIRVCSSIKAFVELGIPAKDIFIKTLSYQNGWSEGMREPLDELIKSELEDYKNVSPNYKIKDIGLEPYFCKPNSSESECSTADGRVYKLSTGAQEAQSLTVDDSNRSFFGKVMEIFNWKRATPAPVEDRVLSK